jgi:DegV family protein with EDD domain
MTVAVITDSASALPMAMAAEARITVVPMWLTLGGQSIRDGELPLAEVLERADEGLTTAGPSPGEFADAIAAALTEAGADTAVVVTVAGTMSGTVESARLAAKELDADVRVIDSGTAAGAEGLVALAAAAAARAGAAVETVAAAARSVADRVHLVATVNNLDRLAKSGRVPEVAAWAGRALKVNPLFEFRDGKARPLRPARSRAAALERIVGIWRKDEPDRPDATSHIVALHALAAGPAHELLERVRQVTEPATAFVGPFSSVMVAHTGPELVGLAWYWD